MKVVGLTGSIGMGKSTAARQLRGMGYPVYDADAVVHKLMKKGGAAVPLIEAEFPGVIEEGAVNRSLLGKIVFGKSDKLKQLESIVHPLVLAARLEWLKRQKKPVVFLDIPLLFEVGMDSLCDAVVLVTTSFEKQRARVLQRPGMTQKRFEEILARQLSDQEKRKRADFLVETGEGLARSRKDLRAALDVIEKTHA